MSYPTTWDRRFEVVRAVAQGGRRSASRWGAFVRERFPPLQYAPLIVLVAAADVAVLGGALAAVPMLALGMAAFFFKLRLFDELKDYDDDKLHKPDRPLVRGLVTHREVHRAIALCFAVELASFASFGWRGLAGMVVAGAYSLLMFRELFIGRWLRAHLTTYAVTHTAVAGLLTLAVAAAVTGRVSGRAAALGVASWCLFNVFEFARKTWASREEKPAILSYSGVHGRVGAALLVLAMAASATALLVALHAGVAASWALVALCVVVGVAGVVYAVTDDTRAARLYRGVAGAYLLCVYGVCAAGFAA